MWGEGCADIFCNCLGLARGREFGGRLLPSERSHSHYARTAASATGCYQPKIPNKKDPPPPARLVCRLGRGAGSGRGATSDAGAASARSGSGLAGVTYDLVQTISGGAVVAAAFLLSKATWEFATQRLSARLAPRRQISPQTGSRCLCRRMSWVGSGRSADRAAFTRSVKSLIALRVPGVHSPSISWA
jgi:hypothetical protein